MDTNSVVDLIISLVGAVTPSVVVGIVMARFNSRQKKNDEHVENRAAARKKESHLALELQMATAKLSYAVAMALKRGRPNGEVEEGVEAYEEASRKYYDFFKDQAIDYLNETR